MDPIRIEVEGSGRPLVLVPGLACAPNVWFKVREPLGRNFELHLVTVAGFGGTPRVDPPVLPKIRDALGDYCSNLEGAVLLGHSLGAFVALWTAARRSDVIRALVAVDGLPYYATLIDLKATPDTMRDRAERERREFAAAPSESAEPKETYFDQHIINPADADYMNRTTPEPDRRAIGDVWYEILTTDIRPEMPNMRVPTLFIAAGQPWVKSPQDVKGVQKYYLERLGDIRDLEFVVAERARHFVMIDDPESFVGMIERFSRLGEA